MKTLARSVGRTDIGGEPLPSVFKAFETNKIIFNILQCTLDISYLDAIIKAYKSLT